MDFESQSALVAKYFQTFDGKEATQGQYQLLDLYRMVQCYRMYKDIDQLLEINPELKAAEPHIRQMWREFDSISNESMAEMALDVLYHINKI